MKNRMTFLLDVAHEAANQDPDRNEVLKDWDAINDISDLVNDYQIKN